MTLLLKITSFDQFGAILAPVASQSNNKTNGFSNTNKEQIVLRKKALKLVLDGVYSIYFWF